MLSPLRIEGQVSFVGKLNIFRPGDLLQMIATTGKTGRLSLTRRDDKAIVVFRNGKIIYSAATSTPRETLGSALLGEGLITAEQLEKAIELQRAERRDVRLGQILVESGLVERTDLERIIEQQIEKVISDLMSWKSGFFRFDLLRLAEGGEVEVDTKDYLLDEGVGTDQVLLSIAVRLDELERDQGDDGAEAAGPESEGGLADRLEGAPITDLTPLSSVIREIRSPELTGELTARLAKFASKVFRRSVLFAVRPGSFDGLAGTGVAAVTEGGGTSVRDISLPFGQPSILREVVERAETFCGPLPFLPMNRLLVERLGGGSPAEVAAVPLSVSGRVVLVLYGDNHPDNDSIGSLAALELLVLEIGLVMEKQLFQKRVKELEVLRHLLLQG